MQSATPEYPDGLANNSGVLGHYLMDHLGGVGASGTYAELKDTIYYGQRPGSVCIPRFRNVKKNDQPYVRGYLFENWINRQDWTRGFHRAGIGAEWKEDLTKPGDWSAYFEAYGETLPEYNNKVSLSKDKKDKWGLPVLEIDMQYGENEKKMAKDMQETATEMLTISGLQNVKSFNYSSAPGSNIHEMGTARMGNDPKTSVLNKWNQSHDISNLFITDGSCMVSSACQNPSLTYMALTARACDYAVKELKKNGKI